MRIKAESLEPMSENESSTYDGFHGIDVLEACAASMPITPHVNAPGDGVTKFETKIRLPALRVTKLVTKPR